MDRDVTRALARRWRWILRTSLLAGGLAAAVSWALPRQWESTVILLPPDRRTDAFTYSGGLKAGLRRTLEAFRMRDRAHPAEIYRAVLRGDELARRLVRRFDLASRWNLDAEEDAVARLSRAMTTTLVPYGPIRVSVRISDRELAADLANEAATILEARLAELYRDDVEWERSFLADALAAHREEAERLNVDLANYRAGGGLIDPEEQREAAGEALRELATRISRARLDRAEQARLHGSGSPAEADAARRVEALEGMATSLPSELLGAAGDRIRQEELRSLEQSSKYLLALRQRTFSHEAGHSVGVRVLDPALPADAPDRRPLLAAVLLAMIAIPGSIVGRVWAPRISAALTQAGREASDTSVFSRTARIVEAAAELRTPALVAVAVIASVAFSRQPLIAAGVLGAVFVVLATVDRTKAWLLLLIALPWAWNHVDRFAGFGVQIPTEPGIILLVAAWAWAVALRGSLAPPPRALGAPIVATLVWLVISSLTSIDPKHSLFQIVATTGFILGGALFPMCEIRRLETLERVMTIYLTSGALLAVYGLVQVFTSPLPFDRAGTFIGAGVLYNHGPYAAFLGFALGVGFVYLLWGGGRGRSTPVLIATALMTFATIVSVTRAAWLATLALLGVMAVTRWRRSLKTFAAPVIVAAAALAIVIATSPGIGRDLSAYLERSISVDYGSNAERLNRWLAGWQMARANPVFGVGPSAYETAYPAYREAGYVTRLSDRRMGSHSDLVRTAAEQGLPGLLIMAWLVVAFYRTGIRLMREGTSPRIRRLAAAVSAGVFTYTVHGVFNEYWRLPKIALTLWVFVGVLGALERIDREARAELQPERLSPETPI